METTTNVENNHTLRKRPASNSSSNDSTPYTSPPRDILPRHEHKSARKTLDFDSPTPSSQTNSNQGLKSNPNHLSSNLTQLT